MHPGFSAYRERLGGFIRRAYRLSAAEIDAAFESLALDLFRLQFERVGPYRRLCESRGTDPAHVTHWRAIPGVPTAAFKEFALTSLEPEDRTRVFHSSGTTGQQPSRHFHNAASLRVYEQSLWPPFQRHLLAGLETTPRLLCLSPSPARAPHSSLVHMFDTVRRELPAPPSAFMGRVASDGSWELDLNVTQQTLAEVASSGRPALVLGTAFSFVQLLDAFPDDDPPASSLHPRRCFVLPPGSRVMETGGYKGRTRELPKAGLYRLIGERLGVPPTHIVGEYAMSELSSQAYDHVAGTQVGPAARCFHFPPWARALLTSPETGEPVAEGESGLLRVFDLANVHSVMAIQTDDLGVRRGDGFELVGRAPFAEPRGCSRMAR
jgi:hypothetical protein